MPVVEVDDGRVARHDEVRESVLVQIRGCQIAGAWDVERYLGANPKLAGAVAVEDLGSAQRG